MSNEFDAAVAASMQPDQGQAARMGFVSAVDTNPDSYADAQRIARRNGVPVDTVLNLPQEMKRQDVVGSIDFNALAKTSPSTAALLADVEKAKIAHDDVENMSSIEEAISFIKGTGSAIVSAAPKFNEGAWGLARAGADLLPSFIGRPMADKFAQYGKMQRDVADSMMPKGENIVSASWYSGMQSLGLNLLQLPLGIGGKMAPVLTSMGLSTGGQAYGEARDKGVNVPTALSFATSQGVVEAGTEMFGMPALFSMLKPGKFGTKAVEYLIKEQGGEQVATALQDLNEWAVLPENKNKTIGDYLKARPEAALQTALSTAFSGGGQVAVMKAASMIGQYAEKSARAEQSGAALDKLADLAKASKVLQRDPEAFAQFVEQAAEGGTEQVFIDANALMQSGVAEQIAAVSPAVASQLENALQIGGQIAIPVGEFAASIAPTEFYQSIAEHIKTEPEGFSRAEAQQYMQQHSDELKSEVERVLADKQGDSTFKASQEAVKQQVLEQLNALNRFTTQKNEIDATLIAARTAVRAAQLGMMPEEFYRGRALRFRAESVAGDALNQFAGTYAMTADRFALDSAKKMLEAGKPAELVRKETGWHRGVDGKWRFEISDHDAKFIGKDALEKLAESDPYKVAEVSLGDVLDHPALYAAYPNLRDIRVEYEASSAAGDELYHGASYSHHEGRITLGNGLSEDDLHSALLHEVQHAIQSREYFAKGGSTDAGFIRAVKDAFAGMEDAARQNVLDWKWYNKANIDAADQASQVARYALMYESAQRLIDHANRERPSGVFRNIRQELQWIYAEDFYKNEAARELQRDFYGIPKSGVKRNQRIGDMAFKGARLLLDHIPEELRQKFKDDPRTLKGMIKALKRESAKKYKELQPLRDLERKASNAKGIKDEYQFASAFDVYEALAGEIEARNTQARQHMTDEERRNTSPHQTADIQAEKAIVMFGGMDVRAPMASIGNYVAQDKGNAFYQQSAYTADTIDVDGVTRQTTNSNGQRIAQTEEGLRNFWRWFGDSRVVDKDGKPLVVYHGSDAEFDIFSESYGGIYFAEDPSVSEFFAEDASGNRNGAKPFYLRVENILDATTPGAKDVLDKVEAEYDNKSDYTDPDDGEYMPLSRWVKSGYLFKLGRDVQNEVMESISAEGYDGVRYVDASPATGDSISIVVFDPKQIKSAVGNQGTFDPASANVLEQNNGENRGSFSPSSLTISLMKGADLSTFLHESAHYFFEDDIALASELVAVRREGATLSEGEQQIVDDVSALLSWHGLQGDIGEQLNQWYAMSFEERRQHHERTAESFEKYLMEGKAPSFELQRLFQTFRAWLKSVYTSVKNFLESHPEAGNLNDEIRRVFDRMLATADEIKLAQQGRSMMPLFDSAEQAGMSMDEFARYHADDTSATNAGIDEMQARAMRDMAYSRNAHARMVQKLKAEAKEKRIEMRMDARRQVMSQPVYRAWQFLTGKLADSDKISAPEKRKSDPDTLDETRDSLFVAIAKLGGISRESVESEWGFDAKERSPMPVFGKHLLRREGGLTIDGMAEALGQYGYLSADENGKHDLHEFEDKFAAELRGDTQYSMFYDPAADMETRAGDQVANPHALTAARIDLAELRAMGLPDEVVNTLQARRMTASVGLHPDVASELIANDDGSPAFSSGDELVRALAAAVPPSEAIESLTDRMMLEAYGELASPEAIEQAADKAIHNDVRARFVATEANALAKMLGKTKLLNSAAKAFAANMIDSLKVRNIKPGQYASAEVRAAKAADKAFRAGDKATALAEKRNQAINIYATRAAYDALEEVDKGLRYLGKFDGNVKGLDAGYAEQIDALLERFDLRKGQSLTAIDKRTSLAEWMAAEREKGIEPDIPPELQKEAYRTSYKNMTMAEFRGLVDTVKQLDHLGRLKHRLLTAADQRAYEAVRDEIAASIREHAGNRQVEAREPTTNTGRAWRGIKRFWFAHQRVAMLMRTMDGGNDGGPLWEYFIRPANERGNMEATMRAEATAKLSEILAPVFKLGKMGGKGIKFDSIGRSLNRESRIAIALNMGNDGNMQRLLGGEGWTLQQIAPVLQSLTTQEWQAVQAIWDHLESYRPLIGAKEMRVYGKEPDWVEARPFSVTTADGQAITLRGGYYPVKYDPAASQRAEEHSDAEGAKRQLQGAYTSATTRRSFTKSRVEAVIGRPLMYTLSGLYSGVNDVIHDLAWHEWLIDTNRLMRSQTIDEAIREHYGPEAKAQIKSWIKDIAEGDKGVSAALDDPLGFIRKNVSVAGLGFNAVSAIMQPLGITQSIVRVGAKWVGAGIGRYIANPVALTDEVKGKSEFMENRARTRLRELNELRNQVQDQSAVNEFIGKHGYKLMMFFQQTVDVPTWWGAYQKALSEGNDEARAVALADQAVIDSQGGGETKDLSAIERGGPAQRLFTVFYNFMATALNLGISKTMSADTPAKRAKLISDYSMLYVVPVVLGHFLKSAITPGDSGDDDWEALAKKLIAEELDYLMGLMVVVREFGEAVKIVAGVEDQPRGYSGPAGVRMIADAGKLAVQVRQGEADDALRKSAINMAGDLTGIPSAQLNRTITGAKAIDEGKTSNPAAIVFGYKEKR